MACCCGHAAVEPAEAPTTRKESSAVGVSGAAYIELEHGGVVVETSIGNVQFGIPPETIKDSMRAGLQVPTFFVVFGEMFDRNTCLNFAEFEFPTYFNFFIKKQKVTLVVEEAVARRMRTIFRETLLGPEDLSTLVADFQRTTPRDAWPNFTTEGRDLGDPRYKEEPLSVGDLIDFVVLNEDYVAEIGAAGAVKIRVNPVTQVFTVHDQGVKLCEFPVSMQCNKSVIPDDAGSLTTLFLPPDFGVTFIGTSHGFDPNGRTSGFVLWIGRRGIIVDPPPYTSHVLTAMGIAPRLIDSVILSHCHADHDAGSFQKILRSSNVRVITTTTIMASFIRKYSAISGFESEFIQNLFQFVAVKIGVPLAVHGGEITFQYSLHTIPCISLTASYGGKRIAFSGDTCYNPALLEDMHKRGTIGKGRLKQLLNFDWGADVIIHEAGVPPIHTPISILQSLPEDVKSRLYVIHAAAAAVATDSLRRAVEGQTIRMEVTQSHDIKAEVVDLISHINIYRELISSKKAIKNLIQSVEARSYTEGAVLFRVGDNPDAAYVVISGIVRERGQPDQYIVGDFFGELAVVMDQPRHAEFYCETACELLVIERSRFLALIAETTIGATLQRIFSNVVNHHVRKMLKRHSLFAKLPSCLAVQVEAIMHHRVVLPGERLWSRGRPVDAAYFILSGELECSFPGSSRPSYIAREAALLCDTDAVIVGGAASCTLTSTEEAHVMMLPAAALVDLFAAVPGLMVLTVGSQYSR